MSGTEQGGKEVGGRKGPAQEAREILCFHQEQKGNLMATPSQIIGTLILACNCN